MRSFLLLLLSVVSGFAANPTLTNFVNEDFTILPLASSPTNVVHISAARIIEIITTNGLTGEQIWTNTNLLTTLKTNLGATILAGQGVIPWWNPSVDDGLVIVHDSSLGESQNLNMVLAAVDNASSVTNYSQLRLNLIGGADPALAFSLLSLTNSPDPFAPASRFNIALQPSAGVAHMELINADVRTFFVADTSGYSGAGTKSLTDDGTYKLLSSGSGAITNFTFVGGTNIVVDRVDIGTNSTVTINSSYSANLTNYNVVAGSNAVVTSAAVGTNLTFTVSSIPPVTTNYNVVAGTNVNVGTVITGTNVVFTINSVAAAGTNYSVLAGTNVVVTTGGTSSNVTFTVNSVAPLTTNYFFTAGTNVSLGNSISGTNTTITINSGLNPTDGVIPARSGTNFVDSPFTVSGTTVTTAGNIGAVLAVGPTTYVDVLKASATNLLSGNLTYLYGTNGVHLLELTCVTTLFNPTGTNCTITLPSGWHNVTGTTFVVTNATVVELYAKAKGPTSSSALQTNMYSNVQYFP